MIRRLSLFALRVVGCTAEIHSPDDDDSATTHASLVVSDSAVVQIRAMTTHGERWCAGTVIAEDWILTSDRCGATYASTTIYPHGVEARPETTLGTPTYAATILSSPSRIYHRLRLLRVDTGRLPILTMGDGPPLPRGTPVKSVGFPEGQSRAALRWNARSHTNYAGNQTYTYTFPGRSTPWVFGNLGSPMLQGRTVVAVAVGHYEDPEDGDWNPWLTYLHLAPFVTDIENTIDRVDRAFRECGRSFCNRERPEPRPGPGDRPYDDEP
ncbi:MAG: trypsin-like peptidase domain-containing protein [Myxococcota bacterium]